MTVGADINHRPRGHKSHELYGTKTLIDISSEHNGLKNHSRETMMMKDPPTPPKNQTKKREQGVV